jgi:hypothetical protein
MTFVGLNQFLVQLNNEATFGRKFTKTAGIWHHIMEIFIFTSELAVP